MIDTPHKTEISESPVDWPALLVIAVISSLVSIIATGYLVGVRNHVYILPIVNALYDESQFANDSFIQSLRYYSSGPWILLSGIAKHLNIYWLFLCLDFLSRFIAFTGFLACATTICLKERREMTLLAALLCTTSLLRGQSLAGDGGLFIDYFTHSEIANGLTLLIIFFLIRGRLLAALVTNGLVFFTNAFIGVWNAVPIAAITLAIAVRGEVSRRDILLKGLIGSLLAILLATPVIRNILTNPDFGNTLNFDYVAYLEEFWPYHFIFDDIATYEKIDLASLLGLGIASFVALGKRSRLFLIAIASFSAVYVVGIIVPHVTHSALLLNLHLLRVSTMLQLLTAFGALALATKWWFAEDPIFRFFFSPVLILLLCSPIKMTSIQPALNSTVAIFIIASSFRPNVQKRIPQWLFSERLKLKYLSLTLVAAGFLVITTKHVISDAHAEAWFAEWKTVGNWVELNTEPKAIFIIPTWNFRGNPQQAPPGTDWDEAILTSGAFELIAHRSVWIDFRGGAAVLWSPSYYEQWRRRVIEINAATSFAARRAYAKANGIGYIIDVCERYPASRPVFRTERLCVYASS